MLNEPDLAHGAYKRLYPEICRRCGAATPAAAAKGIERAVKAAWHGRPGPPPPTAGAFLQYAAGRMLLGNYSEGPKAGNRAEPSKPAAFPANREGSGGALSENTPGPARIP